MGLYSRWKQRKLQYEFLPAAEEIVESPASPFGYAIIWLVFLLVGIALLWSYFGKLDIVATAVGSVVPDGSVKTVQAASAGIVEDIKIAEGQKVAKGQVIVQLQNGGLRSEAATIEKALAIAKLERDIDATLARGGDPGELIANADIADDVRQHLHSLAISKTATKQAQQQALASNVAGAQQQANASRQALQNSQGSLQKLRDREKELTQSLEGANPLVEANIRNEVRSVQAQQSTLESSIASQSQQIAQMDLSVNQANDRVQAFQAEQDASAYGGVVTSDKKVAELEGALIKARQAIDQLTITSPVDGRVLSLTTKTVGGVVGTSQQIAEIVPGEAQLVVDAVVQNRDIGFIRVGQPVVVKVDTYSFQRYGYLNGTVKDISPDAVRDEKQGLVYKAKIAIKDDATSKNRRIMMTPGMSVTAEVTTGKRRIIEFFLDPLMTHIDTSLEVR